jgi:hypothetical protein
MWAQTKNINSFYLTKQLLADSLVNNLCALICTGSKGRPLQFLAGEAGGRWGLARRAGDGAAAQDVALRPGRHGVGIVYKAVLTGREAQVRAIARFRHPQRLSAGGSHHGAACAVLGLRLGVPSLVMQVTTLNFVPNCFSMCEI